MARIPPQLSLSAAELDELMTSSWNMRVATVGPGERINVTPLWFGWAAEHVYFFGRGQKVANLRRNPTCTVLGMFEDWQCAMAESHIGSGDMLALYTDGVTESFNEAQEEFGEERLIEALRRHARLGARGLAAAIVDEVAQFSTREQYDDITLIIAKRTGD